MITTYCQAHHHTACVECTAELMQTIMALMGALREYGSHRPGCELDPCTCGFAEALTH